MRMGSILSGVALGLVSGMALCRVMGGGVILRAMMTGAGLLAIAAMLAGRRFGQPATGFRGHLPMVGLIAVASVLGWFRADRHCDRLATSALAGRLIQQPKYRADVRGIIIAEPTILSNLAMHVPLRATHMRLRGESWVPIPPERMRIVLIARKGERETSFEERLAALADARSLGDSYEFKGLTIQRQRGFADLPPDRPWVEPAGLAHWTSAYKIGDGHGSRLRQAAIQSRRVLADAFQAVLDPLAYRLAAGTVLGLRAPVYSGTFRDMPMRDIFARAGIGHLLAVSGLHVSIIAAGLCAGLTKLRCPRPMVAMVAMVGIGFYVLMVGMPACTIRAGMMNAIGVTVWAFAPRHLPRALILGLCASAATILLIDPGQLFEVGFQISFLSVLSLVTMAPLADAGLARLGWSRLRPLRALMAAQSALLFGVLLPISPLYFGHFSVAGLLVNLIAIPLSGILLPTTLVVGLLALVPGPGLWLARLAGWLVSWLYRLLAETAWLGARLLPYPETPRPPGWMVALYYAALAAVVCRLWRYRTPASQETPRPSPTTENPA